MKKESQEPSANVNFGIPKRMLNEIDNLIETEFYSNRSEIMRCAMREFLIKRSEDV